MRRIAALCLIAAVALGPLAQTASAQEGIFANMQKGIEFRASDVETTTTFASGLVTRTRSKNLFPTLTLTIDSLIYPSLRLNTGGVFELNTFSTTTDSLKLDSTIVRNRPFFVLRSTNPILSPGFGYFRREDRSRTQGISNVKLVNDELAAYLGWNPAGGPRSDFQFVDSHTFDDARRFQDLTRRFATLVSNYTHGNLGAYYRGSYLDTDNTLEELRTKQIVHAGRVSDAEAFFNRRLLWNGSYNINYQDVHVTGAATAGEVDVPVRSSGGLSAVSDLPSTARLTQNPLLVDGNLTASAGVDLGLPAPGEDTQARNIGVDLLNRTEINRFLVWVDRDIPFEAARSFSWEIYSSTDNIAWTREATVPTAPFGPFENRFEIDFPSVTARYVKLVTRPLGVTVQDASRFPDIFVTEIQAFVRRQAGELAAEPSQTTHLVNSDVRFRLLDTPGLTYEGFYFYNGPDTFGRNTSTLSNGLSANQTFGIFSFYARAAREQGHDPLGDRDATVTNATFTVDPIPAFRSSLLWSGQDERIEDATSDRRGFFVQNTAQVYRGVNLLFGIGWNFVTRETGEISHDKLLNASGTIVPREHLSLTFSYDSTSTERSGVFTGDPTSHAQRVYAAVAVDPMRTLHLVLGEEIILVTGQPTRTTHDIGVNWAPFPDGTLQFIFAYNEALRALEFGRERSTLGSVRWNLSRKSYVDVSFQRTGSDFVFQKNRTRIFSISVRLFA